MNIFNDYLNAIELPILKEFHDFLHCGFLDAVIPVISSLCKWGAIWIAIGLVLLLFKKTRKTGLTVTIALIFGLLICNLLLKPLTMRIRPYVVDPTITLLLPPELEYSFPSGHVIASFEGAVGIFLNNKKWGTAALILAVLISFSRLYLLMHYFTDVIVSIILGTVFAVIAYNIVKKIFRKKELA